MRFPRNSTKQNWITETTADYLLARQLRETMLGEMKMASSSKWLTENCGKQKISLRDDGEYFFCLFVLIDQAFKLVTEFTIMDTSNKDKHITCSVRILPRRLFSSCRFRWNFPRLLSCFPSCLRVISSNGIWGSGRLKVWMENRKPQGALRMVLRGLQCKRQQYAAAALRASNNRYDITASV